MEKSIQYTESYIDSSLMRSVLVVDQETGSKPIEVLSQEKKLVMSVANIGGLGMLGVFLEESDITGLLGVEADDEGEYDILGAKLSLSVLDTETLVSMGIDPVVGSEVCVIENGVSGKRAFFRVPELDIAEIFPVEINSSNIDIVASKLLSTKDSFNTQSTGGDYLEYSRRIYGIWKYAVESNDIVKLDNLMSAIYPKDAQLLSQDCGIKSLKTLAYSLPAIKDAGMPAENWWMARCIVKKATDVVIESKDLDGQVGDVMDIIRVIAERMFYPDSLWKLVVEPFMNSYCDKEIHGIKRYEKKAFLGKVFETGVTWISELPEVKKITE